MILNTIPNVKYIIIDYHSAVRGRPSPGLTLIKNAGTAHVSESNTTIERRLGQFVSKNVSNSYYSPSVLVLSVATGIASSRRSVSPYNRSL